MQSRDFSLLRKLGLVPAGLTPILRQSLQMARIDAEARFHGELLWADGVIPRSHFLWTDLYQTSSIDTVNQQGCRKIKIKLGSRLADELHLLRDWAPEFRRNGLRVRLDLNGCLAEDRVSSFFDSLAPILDIVDWVEDPTTYLPELWRRIQKTWKVRLAWDRGSEGDFASDSVSVRVLKPAVQRWSPKGGADLAVTSYLDHPIGQVGAAWVAAQLAAQLGDIEDCGLISHTAYELNAFSERLEIRDGVLVPPKTGTGWGWDDLLEQMIWRELQ
jgi:O-succinylbenzoate synthase